jgi:hypothetical protein
MHQLGGELIPAMELPRGPTVFNGEVLALTLAEGAQLLQEYRALLPIRRRGRRANLEHADPGNFPRWLRLGGKGRHEDGEGQEDEKATRHGSLRRSQMGRVFYMRYVREGNQILQIKPGSWALLVMR